MADKPTFECVVSADLFRRAAMASGTEAVRYYLNGVHVSPAPDGGAVIVATNGSCLIAMHDPDAIVQGEGIVLLSKQMRATLKAPGALLERRLLIARAGDGAVQRAFVVDVATAGKDETYSAYGAARALFDEPDSRVKAAQFGAVTIDGVYPDWRRVLPSSLKSDESISPIDMALLAVVAEALSGEKKSRNIRLTSSGRNDPVLVTSTSPLGVSGFGIVMPLRTDDRAAAIPSWVKSDLAKAA